MKSIAERKKRNSEWKQADVKKDLQPMKNGNNLKAGITTKEERNIGTNVSEAALQTGRKMHGTNHENKKEPKPHRHG